MRPWFQDALLDRVEDAAERITALDWKLKDVVVAVVRDLDGAPPEVMVSADRSRPARGADPRAAGLPGS